MIVSPGYVYRFEYHGSTRTVVITRTNIGDSLAPNDVVGFGGVELESSKYKNYSSDKCRNIRNAVYDAFEIPKPFNNKKQKYVSFLAESLENVQWALVNPYFSDEIIVVYNEEEIFDGVILTNPDGEELRLGLIITRPADTKR